MATAVAVLAVAAAAVAVDATTKTLHGGRDDSILSAIHKKCSLKLHQDGNSC
jgi:hypothetical protein